MANHKTFDILVWVEGMTLRPVLADAKGTDLVNTQTQAVIHPFRMRKKAVLASSVECSSGCGDHTLAAVSSKRAAPEKEEEEAATRR